MNNQRLFERIHRDIKGERAVLSGFKLHFSKDNTLAEPYADIVESKNDKVYGVLYKLTQKELEIVDNCEGIGIEGDESYYRKTVDVEYEGKIVKANVYIMSEKREFEEPQEEYFGHLMEGLKSHKFDEEIIQKVLESASLDNI